MAIRFKTVQVCWWTPNSNNDPSPTYVCVDQVLPIRDWNATPGQLNKLWTQGTVATSLYQDITFPELEFVYSYPVNKYKFKIRKISSAGIDWLSVHSNSFGNAQEFVLSSNSVVRFFYDFINLDNIPVGTHTIDVFFDAYGINDQNNEVFVENFSTTITLTVKAGTGISTDKNIYNLTFNKANNTLSGDEKIIVYSNDSVNFTTSDLFIQISQAGEPGVRLLNFLNNSNIQSKSIGNYTGTVILTQSNYTKTITVNLDVINDATEFDVNPKNFAITVQKTPGNFKTLTANISNPNNLNILVDLKPTFISEASITNNVLTLKTENSSNLAIGNYAGKVILRAGSRTKEISISLSVIQSIEHDFKNKPYYFAEDPNKATIYKINSTGTYVKMKLEMYFKGYGEEFTETQEGSIPFFKGMAEFYPGEEINDFFIRCRNFKETADIQYLMNLASVKITFSEMNDKDVELSSIILDNLLFAPGKKPLCFPVLTNYKIRRTFPKSEIKLPIDRLSTKSEIEELKTIYLDNLIPEQPNTCIDLYTFKRDHFKSGYEKK
ncbi:hypothetical protein [Chryseobacterium sp. MEBOG07]|uniref:hypothetical protein n=1 Tax=Chryseobacterium sp. MEBOG07 TaxID=2879939 RepID=UPI001F469078|nr:hypothetical protein [Chryseobacterium sp. MEBOG07]UKB81273.1 hypothetical protein LF886_09860 [Chryseobacterium sp. MEBOG07]